MSHWRLATECFDKCDGHMPYSTGMNDMEDLFADQGAEFSPSPDRLEVVAGKVVATMNKPSAVQKRFNMLMARVEAEQAMARTLRHAVDTHAPAHLQALREMQEESLRLCKQMMVLLDQRIQAPGKPNGLTANQKQQAFRIVLSLCEQLADTQDGEVQALWTRYAPADEEDADLEAQAMQEAQAMMASFLGSDFAPGRAFDSPEEMLHAALAHEQQKHQAQAAKREAKRAARRAKKGASARELAAEQQQLDAKNALRTMYRQLASALHPDREPDAQVRAEKTALMSEVNGAYERGDLSALLRIQLQAELADAGKAAAISEARLKAMCDLLAAQVKTLEMDNTQMRDSMDYEFGYPAYVRFNDDDWVDTLRDARDGLQDELSCMRADLQRVQDDKGLKAWLKEQTRASKAQQRQAEAFNMDDVLYAMMRRA